MLNQEKYLKLFYAGIFILCSCIIAVSISQISQYNDIDIFQKKVLAIPYIISYTLIIVGFVGYIGLFERIINKKNKWGLIWKL